MESHEGDLRSEVGNEDKVHAIQTDYRSAGLGAHEIALLDYAVKLTKAPASIGPQDIDALRRNGFTDEQIVDAAHCTGYFNSINRVLDGLGVDPEPFMRHGR